MFWIICYLSIYRNIYIYISKYKKVGELPIRIVYSLTFRASALRQRETDEGPMLETLDYTIRSGSTPTSLYFDLYLYSAYAAHYVYLYLYIYVYK